MADTHTYDIIIFGGGVAGLWLGCRLQRAGYNILLVEKDRLGCGQTLASQGMIHGGQKYALSFKGLGHTDIAASCPARWEECFEGFGDIDLSAVKFSGESQFMWPAGGVLSRLALALSALAVRGRAERMKAEHYPEVLKENKKFSGPVYELHEKVLDVKSLVSAMAAQLKGRIVKGEMSDILPDGQVAVSGKVLKADVVICAGGSGNEDVLRRLGVSGEEKIFQRRPLRQVMVKTLPHALHGHAVTTKSKPRMTVTSHPVAGGHVWYLGGSVAEAGAHMTEEQTLRFAKEELKAVFPHIDWGGREWASLAIDRAEPCDATGQLPPGPHVHQRGRVLVTWPVKLTMAPLLGDKIFVWLQDGGIQPGKKTAAPDLPVPETGLYPWEAATWQKL